MSWSYQDAFPNYTYLSSQESCWDILEIEPTFDLDRIKQAYRQQARKAHPDLGGSHQQFIRIQQAYEQAKRWFSHH